MAQLKKLLVEEKKLNFFENELNSGNWYYPSPDKLLFRGEGGMENIWEIKGIRKDREPRDTNPLIHAIVDAINEVERYRVPKRSEAKFAGGSNRVDDMEEYGDLTVCFPEKSQKIYYLEGDSFTDFMYANKKLKDITFLSNEDIENLNDEYQYFSNFFYILNQVNVDLSVLYNFIKETYRDTFNQAKKLSQTIKYGPDIKSAAKSMKRMFQIIEDEYYEKIDRGVNPNAHEHIFGGDQYLSIKKEVFEENFEYVKENWRLKR